MTQANDSILITPGSGATVATHLANSKEHQVVMLAESDGHILGTKAAYVYNIGTMVWVTGGNQVVWDMFNADASLLVRVHSVRLIPDMVTAVATGVACYFKLARTTAVGTGGSAQTAWAYDTNTGVVPTLDADITCRTKPTGGATESTILRNFYQHGEETNTSNQIPSSLGGIELIPELIQNRGGIVLRQNEGLRVVQITSTALGNSGWLIAFTVE
jgi:hypothetical protein